MQQYKELIRELIEKYDSRNGNVTGDRTGTGTVKVAGRQMRFDLNKGFPLLTLKRTSIEAVMSELLWFISGSTDNRALFKIKNGQPHVHWATYDEYVKTINDGTGNTIWSPWEVKYEDVIAYIKSTASTSEIAIIDQILASDKSNHDKLFELVASGYTTTDVVEAIGTLGPIYGNSWCNRVDERIIHRKRTPFFLQRGYQVINQEDHGLLLETDDVFVRREINQLDEAIRLLKEQPNSRRILVSAWDVNNLPDDSFSPQENVLDGFAALAYCHDSFQFVTEELDVNDRRFLAVSAGVVAPFHDITEEQLDGANIPKHRLNCIVRQRSVDTAVGLPFNIASYAMLTMMVAQVVNMELGDLVMQLGDVHLYANHVEPMRELLDREEFPLPKLILNKAIGKLDNFQMGDAILDNYQAHPMIKLPVAV